MVCQALRDPIAFCSGTPLFLCVGVCQSVFHPVSCVFCIAILRHFSSSASLPVQQMQVWDTAGQERFRTITQSYYRSAHGAIIAYDITKRATFDSVTHWIKEVEIYGANNVLLVLMGECGCPV